MDAKAQAARVAMTAGTEDARSVSYGQAERRLWDHYGLEPSERYVDLKSFPARLRIVEVGSGEPILFVPGTAGTGPMWGSLLRHLEGFRCLLLDRPGWGLSSPLDYTKDEYRRIVSSVMGEVLDGLGLERSHVVGASIGDVWALRAAQGHPDRIGRVVLMGGGPLVSDIQPPRIIRAIASPLGALMVRVPEKPKQVRSILRSNGHGPSLDAGRIPDEYVDWRASFGRKTSSMRNERAMIRALLHGKQWRPGLTFSSAELGGLNHPVLMIYGTGDPTGSTEVWERFTQRLPSGRLEVIEEAGHVPWLDYPERVGRSISDFLSDP